MEHKRGAKPATAGGKRAGVKDKKAKPFLKWAGGKGQLLTEIERYYPFRSHEITKYAEPFVGGGAVLFDVLNKYTPEQVYIGDINPELINTYKVIRDNVDRLIDMLKLMQNEYIPMGAEKRKVYYLAGRERFNALLNSGSETENLEKAALMIFLNRTCFNGLYRVNKKGQFNVPVGAYKNPLICDEDNLRAVAEKLQNVIIVCGDYKSSASFIDDKTFVYFDPPYRPLTETSGFTAYTEGEFGDKEQRELARFAEAVGRAGARVVVSNSDPKNIDSEDNFFEELYGSFHVSRVDAVRMINSNSAARGKIKELLISNYLPERENMEHRDFDTWISSFRDSIATWKYYTDFDKVYKNVGQIKDELNILNGLIGASDIEGEFRRIVEKFPDTLKAVPILLAKRETEIAVIDAEGSFSFNFKRPNYSVDEYVKFMERTGLFGLMRDHIIHSLVDYVMGVEVGMDTNGRKNRTGDAMEDLVESFLVKAGFVGGETYFKEMGIRRITEKWGIDLSAVSNKGKAEKRFDFVVKTESMIYGIETNFYGSRGSKLNETARSYKTLAREADTIAGFTFVWFTDGKGWMKARNNLEETFDVLEHIYSIRDLENGIAGEIFK